MSLVVHRAPAMTPSENFGPYPFLERETLPKCPLNCHERGIQIEHDLDGQVDMTQDRGYPYYLVRWQGRPDSECSRIPQEDP